MLVPFEFRSLHKRALAHAFTLRSGLSDSVFCMLTWDRVHVVHLQIVGVIHCAGKPIRRVCMRARERKPANGHCEASQANGGMVARMQKLRTRMGE